MRAVSNDGVSPRPSAISVATLLRSGMSSATALAFTFAASPLTSMAAICGVAA